MEVCQLPEGYHVGKYVILQQVGAGAFSSVYLCQKDKTEDKYALKVIDRAMAVKYNMVSNVEKEIRIFSRLDHPNIAKVIEIIYEEKYIHIVMEYVCNGDMQSSIINDFVFRTADQLRIATEILEALNYLHSRNISHRDIKPANIMFDKFFHAKLIDFGFCRDYSTSVDTFCGTSLLMAPEIVCNKTYNGEKADMWSFGVTLHMFATHEYPFNFVSEAQYIKSVKNKSLKIVNRATGIIGWMIDNVLKFNPEERMTAEGLLHEIRDKLEEYTKNFPDVKKRKAKSASLVINRRAGFICAPVIRNNRNTLVIRRNECTKSIVM